MDADFSLHKILKDSTRQKILICLNRNGSLSYTELMNLLKITNTGRFNYHLKILSHFIEKVNDGRYRLTEKGKLAVQFLENFPEIAKNDKPTKRHLNVPWRFVGTSVLAILICLSLFLSFLLINTFNEAPRVQWSKTYGGLAGYSVIQTLDGGYLVVGSNATYSFEERGYIDYNAILLKIDSFGDAVWQKTSPSGEYIVQTTDGGYAVGGTSEVAQIGNNHFRLIENIFLAKLDSQGNLLWNQTFEDDKNDETVYSFVETGDGGYAIVGTTSDPDHRNMKALLVKTNATGGLLWNRTYGESDCFAFSVIQTGDNGYAIVGTAGASFWLIKTDSNGYMQWNQTYHQEATVAYARSGIATKDGGYIMVGGLSSSTETAWVVKTDSNGNMQWNKTYGDSERVFFNHVEQVDDGGYAFSGMLNNQAWIVKTNSKGNMQWNATFDGSVEPEGKSIIETRDGGYALVGTSSSNIWLVKLEPSPKFTLTILAATAIILVAVVAITLFVYFKKQIKT